MEPSLLDFGNYAMKLYQEYKHVVFIGGVLLAVPVVIEGLDRIISRWDRKKLGVDYISKNSRENHLVESRLGENDLDNW